MPEVQVPATGRLPSSISLLGGQIAYQFRLLVRTPRTVIAGLALPTVLLFLSSSANSGHAEDAIVAGLLVFGVITTCYLSHATGFIASRESGVLRRWRAAPLPTWCLFAGRIVAVAVISVVGSAITVAMGILLFGAKLAVSAVPSLLVVIALGALAWAAVGTAVTPLIPGADAAQIMLSITYLPVVLFSGALGSVSHAPTWLHTLVSYLPAQPMIDIATRALQHTGGGMTTIPARDLGVLVAWAAIGLLASVCFFRWDPHRTGHGRPAGKTRSAIPTPA